MSSPLSRFGGKTFCFILVGAALLSACQTVDRSGGRLAQETSAAVPAYRAAAFHKTTSLSLAAPEGWAFSPDGRSVLISSDQSGVFNVYALPITGGAAQPLTNSAADASFAASYFPNDGRILFTADRGGNELRHVFVREADGTIKDLTPGDRHQAGFLGWSADGKRFWLSSDEREAGKHDVYEYDAARYSRRLVFKNGGFQLGPISPDDRWLGLTKLRTSSDYNLYLFDLDAGGEPQLISPHSGNVDQWVLDFTPDSRFLIYRTDQHGEYRQAWTHDVVTGKKAPLVAAGSDLSFVRYSPLGRYRITAVKADASVQLSISDTKTGQPVELRGLPDGNITAARFNPEETQLALSLSSDTSPTDIFVVDLRTGDVRRLTQALNPQIRESHLVPGSVVSFASFDGEGGVGGGEQGERDRS